MAQKEPCRNALFYARQIIETSGTALLILDRQFIIRGGNAAFLESFDLVNTDIDGNRLFDILNQLWNVSSLRVRIEEMFSLNEPFREVEVTGQTGEGAARVLMISGRTLDLEEATGGIAILAIEESDYRRAEEKAAAKRSKQLADELSLMNVELRRSNADLEQFVSVASHDLTAPLRMVMAFTQILERRCRDKFDEQDLVYVRKIINATDRMRELIDSLLSFAHVSSADTEVPLPTDSEETVRAALANLEELTIESKAEVTTERLPTVLVRPTQFLQLMQNLIGNAIKYRNGKTPRVHIEAVKDNDAWLFAVRDNGIGIDPKYAERIFQPFQRLHGGELPGSGLGLAICKKIVEIHGGQIWVRSGAGGGSTFHFTLPTSPNGLS